MRVIVARLVDGYPRDTTDRVSPYPVLTRCRLSGFALTVDASTVLPLVGHRARSRVVIPVATSRLSGGFPVRSSNSLVSAPAGAGAPNGGLAPVADQGRHPCVGDVRLTQDRVAQLLRFVAVGQRVARGR